MIWEVGNTEIPEQLSASGVIGDSRQLGSVVVSEAVDLAVTGDGSVPSAAGFVQRHPSKSRAGGCNSFSVNDTLLWRDTPKVPAAIVQSVAVNVVDELLAFGG